MKLLQEALEMLQLIEFTPDYYCDCESESYANDGYTDRFLCPICEETKEDGHRPSCKLDLLTKKIKLEVKEVMSG